eukprot:IDg5363t1
MMYLELLCEGLAKPTGLPAHTSHVLQPLDVGVFAPLKEKFRQQLSTRCVTSRKDARNDIFTVCELLTDAYQQTVTATNIIGGFRRSGLWDQSVRGPNPDRIRAEDFTSSVISESTVSRLPSTRRTVSISDSTCPPECRIERYKQLYNLFLSNAEELCSDGTVVTETGTIKVTTRSGATLTSDNVLTALQAAERKKEQEASRKVAAAEHRVRRKAVAEVRQRAKLAEQQHRQRVRDDAEEAELQQRKGNRASLRRRLDETRDSRRERAKRRCTSLRN